MELKRSVSGGLWIMAYLWLTTYAVTECYRWTTDKQNPGKCSSVLPDKASLRLDTSLLLTNICAHEQWEHVIIIYDDEHEAVLPEMTERLSTSGVLFKLYHYTTLVSEGGLEVLFLTGSNSWLQRPRVLLICTAPHSSLLLQCVESFDAKYKMRSALSMMSRWLILQDPRTSHRVDLSRVSLINVAIIHCHADSSCCSEHEPSSASVCGQVSTLFWDGANSSLVCVGAVDDVISGRSDVFPGSKWGFNRRLLTVSSLPWEGFLETENKSGVIYHRGLCMDILQELAAYLNFTFKLTQPADGLWGIMYDNGTWAGLVGQLTKSEVDLVIAPLTVTDLREQVMDFTYSFFYDGDTIVYRRIDHTDEKWRTYLKPFKWQVFACIGISLLGVWILLFLIESMTPFYPSNRRTGCRWRHVNIVRTFQSVYGALLAQTDEDSPAFESGKVLVCFWGIFSIVVCTTYRGNLVAFLTVDRLSGSRIDTLRDLVNQNTYKWGFMGGSSVHQMLKSSATDTHAAVWSKVEGWSSEDRNHLSPDINVHYDRVKAGSYAFISDRASSERWKAKDCSLEVARQNINLIEYGVGLPNASAYVRLFSEILLRMHENGLLEELRKKWWIVIGEDGISAQPCQPHHTTATRANVVTVEDMQSAFYMLLAGAVVALLALGAERVLLASSSRRARQLRAVANAVRKEAKQREIYGVNQLWVEECSERT